VNFQSDETGLFAKNRFSEIMKIVIPSNMLAFQVKFTHQFGSQDNTLFIKIGECTQIHSGGVVEATPHFVKV
jgi:hypothetical protein